MNQSNSAQIWWSLPGQPSMFLDTLAQTLEKGCAVLRLEDRLPWVQHLQEIIHAGQGIPVHHLLWDEEALNAGDFVLRQYFSPRERASYFPDLSYGRYVAQLSAPSAILWISCIHTAEDLCDWTEFLCDYHAAGGCLKFILCYDGPSTASSLPVLHHRFRPNQLRGFSTLITSVLSNTRLPGYQAELALQLSADADPELCALLLSLGDPLLRNPLQMGQTLELEVQHIRSACHRAVLACIFPLIESARFRFIQKHFTILSQCLPIRNVDGNLIDDPNDLEIGQLSYMIRHHNILHNLEDTAWIHLCAAVRNQIAHNQPVTYETLLALASE